MEYSTKSVIDCSHSVVSSVAALKMQFIHSFNNSSTCSHCVYNMIYKAFHGPLASTFQLSSAVLSRHWNVNWFNKPSHMVVVHSLGSALTPLSNHYTRQRFQSRHPVYFASLLSHLILIPSVYLSIRTEASQNICRCGYSITCWHLEWPSSGEVGLIFHPRKLHYFLFISRVLLSRVIPFTSTALVFHPQ